MDIFILPIILLGVCILLKKCCSINNSYLEHQLIINETIDDDEVEDDIDSNNFNDFNDLPTKYEDIQFDSNTNTNFNININTDPPCY